MKPPMASAFAELFHVPGNICVVGASAGTADMSICLHSAEDGMETAVALECIALCAALTSAVECTTACFGVTIEPAAYILADVAADGCLVAYQRSCNRLCCFLKGGGEFVGYFNMPASILGGACFLLAVDNTSRCISSAGIPIGILTAFIGAPFFLWLITGRRENYEY